MTTETASPADTTAPVRPVSDADRTWATLARELTPAQSLQRMDTATDRVVRTVTIIGTLLGGFGVFGATKPTVSGPARWITVAAVVCAAAAVACALAAQILTISKHVNPENLAQVRAWYKRRLETRGYPTRAATFLLLVAAVLAGAAAVVALATATPNEPTIAVTRALTRRPGPIRPGHSGHRHRHGHRGGHVPRADQRADGQRDGHRHLYRPGAGHRDGHPGHRRDRDPDADRHGGAADRGDHRAGHAAAPSSAGPAWAPAPRRPR